MLETLHQMGNRIARVFGEPDIGTSGISYKQAEELKDCLSGHLFSNLLAFDWYVEEYGIFINQNSLGFAIEVYPLAGCDETHQKEIHHLFEEVLEEEASIQCLLFADHRIDSFLHKWQGSICPSGVFGEMTQKRIEFFQKSKKNSPRVFRCVFSYTVPFQGIPDQVVLRSLQTKKRRCSKFSLP